MPLLTIDDFVTIHGEQTPTSIVIETSNRFEVAKRLEQNKFSRCDCSILKCLDSMVVEGLIDKYHTKVMRLTFEHVWE